MAEAYGALQPSYEKSENGRVKSRSIAAEEDVTRAGRVLDQIESERRTKIDLASVSTRIAPPESPLLVLVCNLIIAAIVAFPFVAGAAMLLRRMFGGE